MTDNNDIMIAVLMLARSIDALRVAVSKLSAAIPDERLMQRDAAEQVSALLSRSRQAART